MKKILLSAVVAASLGFAGLASAANPTSSGTITIAGKVVSSTCSVSANGSQNPTITLPTVDTNALPAGGSAGWTALTFSVSGCTAVTGLTANTISTYFSSVNVDSVTGYLKNTTSGGSNVEVALSNSQTAALGAGNGLALNAVAGSQNTPTVAIPTGSNTASFNYYVGYVAGTSNATAGAVNTTVQYALSYQ